MRLDVYEPRESGMDAYLARYGWHFSKKMYEWAVSKMVDRNGNKLTVISNDELYSILKKQNVVCNYDGYDGPYVYSMCKADFYGSSIDNETKVCKFVSDYIGDKDGYRGMPFTRFYADTIAKGIPIIWEDML